LELHELAAPVLAAVAADAGLAPADIDEVILGNALGAGGNPARLAALAAGLPERVPAWSLDAQCCAGLDAVVVAASRVRAGDAAAVLAGGVESFSRAPLRARRPKAPGAAAIPYDRPPFSPFPDRDPDMLAAAARLAAERGVTRAAQEAFAIESHARARAAGPSPAILPIAGLDRDAFTRSLTPRLAARLPVLAGDPVHGPTAATVAVEADAAAAVLVVAEAHAHALGVRQGLRLLAACRLGGDPAMPPLAPIAAARAALARAGLGVADLAAVEVMEAFAVQAMVFGDDLAIPPAIVGRHGGALARGHPIAASGAILLADLFHRLRPGERGLVAIAAAGGLGTALVVEAVDLRRAAGRRPAPPLAEA
jgi:acetyl-CoA C-acetyltransferase